jgi:hypothetical protein
MANPSVAHSHDPEPQRLAALRKSIASISEDVRWYHDEDRWPLGVAQTVTLMDIATWGRAELVRQAQLQAAGKFKFTSSSPDLPLIDADVASAVIALRVLVTVEPEAVEGLPVEIVTYNRGRSRRLRDAAAAASRGICEVVSLTIQQFWMARE